MTILHPKPLTAAAFAPFGDVIEARGTSETINYGATQKFAELAAIQSGPEGRAVVHLYRSTPPPYPFALRVMENHPLGSQLFMPLGRPFLVVVAPRGAFDPQAIVAFAVRPDQGVNIAPGVWHHYSLALGAPSDFLVVDRDGPGDNLQEIALDGSIAVAAPDTA